MEVEGKSLSPSPHVKAKDHISPSSAWFKLDVLYTQLNNEQKLYFLFFAIMHIIT